MDDWRHNVLNEIAVIQTEIEKTVEHLQSLRKSRDRLRKKLYDGRTNELRGKDSLLVLISEVRPAIKQWIDLYDRQHGKGGQLLLAERSNVSTRRIRSIVNGTGFAGRDGRFITLQTAERLLTGMDMGYRVADLEIYETGTLRPEIPQPPFSHFEEE